MFDQYRDACEIFARYWQAYGGFRALAASPYSHIALILTVSLYPLWITGQWVDMALSIIPSLLGFSLGAFAMLISVGDDLFRSALAGRRPNQTGHSPLMLVAAAFAHYLIFQTFALIAALLAKAHFHFPPHYLWPDAVKIFQATASGFGFWVFVYALILIVPAIMSVFRVVSWYDKAKSKS